MRYEYLNAKNSMSFWIYPTQTVNMAVVWNHSELSDLSMSFTPTIDMGVDEIATRRRGCEWGRQPGFLL